MKTDDLLGGTGPKSFREGAPVDTPAQHAIAASLAFFTRMTQGFEAFGEQARKAGESFARLGELLRRMKRRERFPRKSKKALQKSHFGLRLTAAERRRVAAINRHEAQIGEVARTVPPSNAYAFCI